MTDKTNKITFPKCKDCKFYIPETQTIHGKCTHSDGVYQYAFKERSGKVFKKAVCKLEGHLFSAKDGIKQI